MALGDFTFSVSAVQTQLWLPPLVAFVISFFTSQAGVSGAFLLLPFQMSVLGFTSPAVSPTNLVYNVVGIPAGVYRYLREGRLVWPLTALVLAGSVPGVMLGAMVRVRFLPDATRFKAFVGCVLLVIGARLIRDVLVGGDTPRRAPAPCAAQWRVRTTEFSLRRLTYTFQEQCHSCHVPGVLGLSLVVGIIGGVYGIGGGALIAPLLVTFWKLPVHTVAGATLTSTFAASLIGVAFYQLVMPHFSSGALTVTPDWLLGALFGLGGLGGMYAGAAAQRHVPARWLKLLLGVVLLAVAGRYAYGFVMRG
jgi:uncharacterized membrane protein YfcA